MNNILYSFISKRKTAFVNIFLTVGNKQIFINNKIINEKHNIYTERILFLLEFFKNYNIYIKVQGGGFNSQIEAIEFGLASLIIKFNKDLKSLLDKQNFLKKDVRIKERRKYGLKKARKASQYSKR